MKSGSAIRVPKAAELIAEALRREIVTGELREGMSLPTEAELMDRFDVSRPTLREAIRLLESESLVRVQRGAKGGVRICLPGDDAAGRALGFLLQFRGATLAEVLEARAFIEPPLAGLLAARATDEDIAAMREHTNFEAENIKNFDIFGRATADFHRILVERAGNVALAVIVSMLEDIFLRHVDRFLGVARKDQLRLNKQALANHIGLTDRIEAGDAEAAQLWWQHHMDTLRKVILSELGGTTVLDLY